MAEPRTPVRAPGGSGAPRPGWSLPFKIMFSLGLVLLLLSGAFWLRSLRFEQAHLAADEAENAAILSDLIRRGLHDDMLRNDRADIQMTVASLAGPESLRVVRIYDRVGAIAFASDPASLAPGAPRDELPCLGCHRDPARPRETLTGERRFAIREDRDGRRILSHVEPIFNEPACSTAACHAHAGGTRVLGILLTEFSLDRHDERIRRQVRDFSVFILVYVVALATVGSIVLWQLVLRPVRALTHGTERVAAGDLSRPVPVTSGDEIGRLTASFNAMTEELHAARERAERSTQTLEEEVARKAEEIRRTEGKLAGAEKLAALGRLTAEIAHEIRNPLTALGGYGRRLLRSAESPEAREHARIVVEEAARLEALLKDVLEFSRPVRYAFRRERLAGIVRQSLTAFGERCAERGIQVAAELDSPEAAVLDPAQIRRAVDNLVANAADAMPQGGRLTVSAGVEEYTCARFVVLHVKDTGPGIPPENLGRIFEPFWTTKKRGHGTGLGIPITAKIAEDHGGFLRVANLPEGGLDASLWLPCPADVDSPGPNCWERMVCGRDGPDAADPCPAWPHFGRSCWVVAGTFCEGTVRGTFAAALGECRGCQFFRQVTAGEI